MEKTIYSKEYQTFLNLLRKTRMKINMTQEELAERLSVTQSFISKCERGERRIDIVELRSFCAALGISFQEFVRICDRELGSEKEPK